jgi:DNA-directed RNA polymerase specialized sigma24 family protein
MEARRTDAGRVATMVERHSEALLRVAKRYSLCADDAHDAVQRGLEIYLRRLDRVEPATELAWLKVVVKHEAMAVRRARADWSTARRLTSTPTSPTPSAPSRSASRAANAPDAPPRRCASSRPTRPPR